MKEPVDNGGGRHLVLREDVHPIPDGAVAGDDGASLHVARGNELEKQMGFRPGRSFYFHHEREHD